MSTAAHAPETWLRDLRKSGASALDGLVSLADNDWRAGDPRRVVVLEKAETYGADYVLFRPSTPDKPVVPEALVFVDDGRDDAAFAQLHRRLWSWGAVPLVFRKHAGRVDLLRCAHGPDFAASDGRLRYYPHDTLELLTLIDEATPAPWWDLRQLQAGSLWDDPAVCEDLLSPDKAAQTGLIEAIAALDKELTERRILRAPLRRRLLVLSLLIAYLEDRKVLDPEIFGRCTHGATRFFEVLSDGPGLCALLTELKGPFNGDVFNLTDVDREDLLASRHLGRFATLVEGRTEESGQLSLWQLYSFRDLPVELISHVYQHFVRNDASAVYTPPFLVHLMLDEALGLDRLNRLEAEDEALLDPSCGSGVFLVEAYKRLIAHWRARNGWVQPDVPTLHRLIRRIRGVDLNPDAIELTAFSLCLALCEALDTATLRASKELFPKLRDVSLHHSCFFEAREAGLFGNNIGVVIGNPPFESKLATPGARAAHKRWVDEVPDKQVAYLFLLESLAILRPGGLLCLLQQYNILYNQKAATVRRHIFTQWDVCEALDLISIRGLFGKAKADTKVVALVVLADRPLDGRPILHATFRRTGRVVAKRGFDIDYYDLHWLTREQILAEAPVWRSDLVGGGRVIDLVARLRSMRTLGKYAEKSGWDMGEGFIAGGSRVHPNRNSDHIRGKRFLPSDALGPAGIDASKISVAPDEPIEEPRTRRRFTAPMLLVREQHDLHHDFVPSGYLTYPDQVVGVCAPQSDVAKLRKVKAWLDRENRALRAYVAASSPKVQKATAVMQADIEALPFPPSRSLDISANEQIIIDDIVDYYREFVRLGQKSALLRLCSDAALANFREAYTHNVNAVYRDLRPLPPCRWPGAICQPFVFGNGEVDWSDAELLRDRLARVLRERRGESLLVHRIVRVFDGPFVFLLKPDRLRYWLRSVALRDADDTLADLHAQGL
jgi:N-6 DNA Methylase